jgi:ABC-type Fe3+/spermidine/putrescine transport system ATPase subunit
MVAGQHALELVDVVKRYSRDVKVGPVTFDVKPGEFFSLLGESGSGKTTLLRCIAGFEDVTAGRILLGGEPIQDKPAHRRNVGLVFQNYALFPHRTVFDNVAFGLQLRKVPKSGISEKVAELLRLVGMPDLAGRYPAQLSGGQQQRVAIARALVLEPPLILFDEPLSNLDAKLRVQLRSELRSLQRRLGMTCIFVTHDQSEAFALSDRVAVLANGGLAQIGTPSEIYETPASTYVAEFVGSSNRLVGKVVRHDGDRVQVRSAGGLEVWSTSTGFREGAKVLAMFRPEQVSIFPGVTGNPSHVRAAVSDVTYLGEDTHIGLVPDGTSDTILVVRKSDAALLGMERNAPVSISIAPGKVHLFEASGS